MNDNLCNNYKKLIRQELYILFVRYGFEFFKCDVFKFGEYCNISLKSPYGKLWINFEHGAPAAMIGHPRASFDDVSLWSGSPWFGLGELTSYFGKVTASQLLAELDNPSPEPPYDNEEERTTMILRKIWRNTEPYCEELFTFLQEDGFDERVLELKKWNRQQNAEFEKLTNERYQQMRNQGGEYYNRT